MVAETFGAHDFMVYHASLIRPYTGPASEPAPANAKLAGRDVFVEGLREIEAAWRGGLFGTGEADDPDRFGPRAREDPRVLLAPAAARLLEEEGEGGGNGEGREERAARWVQDQYCWLHAQQTLLLLEASGGGGGGGGRKGGGGGGAASASASASASAGAGGAGGVLAAAAAEWGDAPNRRRRRAEKGRKAKKLRALAKIRE